MIVLALAALACSGAGNPIGVPDPIPSPSPLIKPNIAVVITDDATAADLDSMTALEALANRGVRFERAFTVAAVCKPSRAALQTGQYPQNNGILANDTPIRLFAAKEHETIASLLRDSGYYTALIGKYLNGYDNIVGYVPSGWDEVGIPYPEENSYRQFTLFTAFPPQDFYHEVTPGYDEHYQTDVLKDRAVGAIDRAGDKPFFLYIAPSAPHLPAVPAARHANMFLGATVQQGMCSFDEKDMSDKPGYVQQRQYTPLTSADINLMNKVHRWRLQSLQAVQDLILAVQAKAAASPRPTYVFFVSDNGWEQGQHRLTSGKNYPYEESIRMPFVVLGPVVSGTVSTVVSTVDIAPTIAELAGLPPQQTMDGQSLVSFLNGRQPSSWRTAALIQSHDAGTPGPFWELRTDRWMYTEYLAGDVELYDMSTDPYQCESLDRSASPSSISTFHQLLTSLSTCRGASCR